MERGNRASPSRCTACSCSHTPPTPYRYEGSADVFGKLLARALALPVTGTAVSLAFTLSHAHIESCALVLRWGKADATIDKLRALAVEASEHGVRNSIPGTADRLHMWWREKRANIYSRQVRRSDKLCSAVLCCG